MKKREKNWGPQVTDKRKLIKLEEKITISTCKRQFIGEGWHRLGRKTLHRLSISHVSFTIKDNKRFKF